MNFLPNVNMREVTRLTRAGKLAEALSLLQGREPAARETNDAKAGGWTRLIDGAAPRPHAPSPDKTKGDARFAAPKRAFSHLTQTVVPPVSAKAAAWRRPAPPPLPEGAAFVERAFIDANGSHSYKLYVPSRHDGQKWPVVVMLHGCTQDPDDFAAGTRMNEVAEENNLLVVYPRQPPSANAQKCWNWFDAGQQRREGGEPSAIAGIVREVVADFGGDPSRVYVAGLSAGGAAAANLAATWPDVFAAAGVHSGLACGAARDMPSAFAAMSGGAVVPRHRGPLVPTVVFHGDADRTVNPVNADQVIAQNLPAAGLTRTTTSGETPTGMRFERTIYADAAGVPALERWSLQGAGHAWSGGSAEGSYTEPRGPDASREMVRFFLSHRLG
jgi:poly(hydroxyalkanoate) depolymerase family esterase